MVNLGQTNGLGKAAFFRHPSETIDLMVVFGVNVSMFISISSGSHVHVNDRIYIMHLCKCFHRTSTALVLHGKNMQNVHVCHTLLAAELQLPYPV